MKINRRSIVVLLSFYCCSIVVLSLFYRRKELERLSSWISRRCHRRELGIVVVVTEGMKLNRRSIFGSIVVRSWISRRRCEGMKLGVCRFNETESSVVVTEAVC